MPWTQNLTYKSRIGHILGNVGQQQHFGLDRKIPEIEFLVGQNSIDLNVVVVFDVLVLNTFDVRVAFRRSVTDVSAVNDFFFRFPNSFGFGSRFFRRRWAGSVTRIVFET
jgi:hypothetical protein